MIDKLHHEHLRDPQVERNRPRVAASGPSSAIMPTGIAPVHLRGRVQGVVAQRGILAG